MSTRLMVCKASEMVGDSESTTEVPGHLSTC